MSDFLSHIHIVPTEDGSPTAFLGENGELMHSSHGAWSETLYIYQPLVNWVLEQRYPLRFLSVGLGLGYVEMMVVAEMLRAKVDLSEIHILSFENNPEICMAFQAWMKEPSAVFDPVLEWVAQHYLLPPIHLKEALVKCYTEKMWILAGELEVLPLCASRSAIFYDAFSKKSGESIWTEEFLIQFLSQYAGENCAFATYASTSALKRALKQKQFQLQDKTGFIGKRESTFALRITSPSQ